MVEEEATEGLTVGVLVDRDVLAVGEGEPDQERGDDQRQHEMVDSKLP